MNNNDRENVAIIGIGCRFPGNINNVKQLWDFLCEGKNGIGEIPADRWDRELFYDPDMDCKGKIYVKRGGFLNNIKEFDPRFFNISPREAAFMDPQQRLLLETSWEALEDGGCNPSRLSGAKVGVFVGIFMHDYENIHSVSTEHKMRGYHSATGMSTTIAANRLSYIYNFIGPSMVIDTACSSSLVAVHLACQSILSGESILAVAGGANAILNPEMYMVLCRAHMLAPDGYCKAFDAGADGYTRSEGAGMVVLKKLSEALKDGNPVYAVIKGSAVNQDGKSESITYPNGDSQERAVREALKKADIDPGQIGYVEAHGTGTAVGDPVEVNALGNVLSRPYKKREKCYIGSIKTNIGHTESAAGVAGLIKAALVLKHKKIPPNLHFSNPNPQIPFEELSFVVPQTLTEWHSAHTRYASVNSFGFGGTNSHVVLEEVNHECSKIRDEYSSLKSDCKRSRYLINPDTREEYVFPFSAHTFPALQQLTRDFITYIQAEKGALQDIIHTLTMRRAIHQERLVVIAHNKEELADKLEQFLSGQNSLHSISGQKRMTGQEKLAFVYSGMGQQWWAMGRELIGQNHTFKEIILKCDTVLQSLNNSSWSIYAELLKNESESLIHKTEIAQVAIFSLQAALTQLWRQKGLVPDCIIGHSTGEVAAAFAAGVFSLEDAMTIIYNRSRLQAELAGTGTMLAIGAGADMVSKQVNQYPDLVSMAAINSPDSVTLAGDKGTLEKIYNHFEKQGCFVRFLKVEIPYHSPKMDSILGELRECLQGITPHNTAIKLFSTVTGTVIDGIKMDREYWCKNVRNPVCFQKAISNVLMDNDCIFLEIGTHPVLKAALAECISHAGKQSIVLASLRRKESDNLMMLHALGRLYTAGYPLDWRKIQQTTGRFIKLPGIQWDRKEYWNESPESIRKRLGRLVDEETERFHPFIGNKVDVPGDTWQHSINLASLGYLKDHAVQGSIVFPGAGYVEMCLAVCNRLYKNHTPLIHTIGTRRSRDSSDFHIVLENFKIKAPFVLEEAAQNMYQIQANKSEIKIFSKMDENAHYWTENVSVNLDIIEGHGDLIQLNIFKIQSRCKSEIFKDDLYSNFMQLGLEYGTTFQALEKIQFNTGESLGKIVLDHTFVSDNGNGSYWIHPCLLDASFQIMAALSPDGTFLPVRIDKIRFFSSPQKECFAYAKVTAADTRKVSGDITITDLSGKAHMVIMGLQCAYVEGTRKKSNNGIEDIVYQYYWKKENLVRNPIPESNKIKINPRYVKMSIEEEVRELVCELGRDRFYEQTEPDLNRLCTQYIVKAFLKLGIIIEPGSSITMPELIEKYGITKKHEKLVNRFFQILTEDGYISTSSSSNCKDKRCTKLSNTPYNKIGSSTKLSNTPYNKIGTRRSRDSTKLSTKSWSFIKQSERIHSSGLWNTLLKHNPKYISELMLIRKIGESLVRILTGEEEGVSILFSTESGLLEQFYYNSPTTLFYNLIIRKVVSRIVSSCSEYDTINILEIGAGTGSLSSHVLPILQSHDTACQVNYCFTDISQAFLNQALKKFKEYSFVNYKVLDLENDPARQGFKKNHFDIIFASDAVHATSSISRSLGYIKSLLEPNGIFIFLEATKPIRWLDLVFGTLEGWWLFNDHDLRPEHPLLSQQQWLDVFEKNGFINSVCIAEGIKNIDTEQSVLMAQKDNSVNSIPELKVHLNPKQSELDEVEIHHNPKQSEFDEVEIHLIEPTIGSNEVAILQEQNTVLLPTENSTYVIFYDQCGYAKQLENELTRKNLPVIKVTRARTFKENSECHFELNPLHKNEIELLFNRVHEITDDTTLKIINMEYLSHTSMMARKLNSLDETVTASTMFLSYLNQALCRREWSQTPFLWIITNNTQPVQTENKINLEQTPLWGLGRVMLTETPQIKTRMADLGATIDGEEIRCLAEIIQHNSAEDEIVLRGPQQFIHRMKKLKNFLPPVNKENVYYFSKKNTRNFDTALLLEKDRQTPGNDLVELKIMAAGLNFKDLAQITGIIPGEIDTDDRLLHLGLECSGIITAVGENVTEFKVGDQVMGLAEDSFSSHIITTPRALVIKPPVLSFDEAATIPVSFLTAYYILHGIAGIKKNQKVLIHTASGGLGIAAFQIAREMDARIFATAGSEEKRDFLKALGIKHVFNSRDFAFHEKIKNLINNTGIDIVLNTLPPAGLKKSIDLLKPVTGIVIELSNIHIDENIGLKLFNRGVGFHSFDLKELQASSPGKIKTILKTITHKLQQRIYSPLPFRVYPVSGINSGLKLMHKARHIGKIVITHQLGIKNIIPTKQRIILSSRKTYLIAGGLGGFGLDVARWMALCGAKSLVLLSRRGIRNREVEKKVEAIRAMHVKVHISKTDITLEDDVKKVIHYIKNNMESLGGIVQAAMVLEDVYLEEITKAQMQNVLRPKVLGTWNLYKHSRDVDLDFFINFSSFSSLVGNTSQGNYAAGNYFLDSFSAYCQQENRKVQTIGWGAVADIGYVSQREDIIELFKLQGIEMLSLGQVYKTLTYSLTHNIPHLAVMPINWQEFPRYSASVSSSPRFINLVEQKTAQSCDDHEGKIKWDSMQKDPEAFVVSLKEKLVRTVASVLGIPSNQLDNNKSFDSYGLDSLMSVELNAKIKEIARVDLPKMTLLQKGLNLNQLIRLLIKELSKESKAIQTIDIQKTLNKKSEKKRPQNQLNLTQYNDFLYYTQLRSRAKARLFCFPYLGAGASLYNTWSSLCSEHVEVFQIQIPARENRVHHNPIQSELDEVETPQDTTADINLLLEDLYISIQPLLDKPFYFYGHSFGGNIAFLLAAYLLEKGTNGPACLYIGAASTPKIETPVLPLIKLLQKNVTESGVKDLLRKLEVAEYFIGDTEWLDSVLPAIKYDLKIINSVPDEIWNPINVPITVVSGEKDSVFDFQTHLAPWKKYTNQEFNSIFIDGGHLFINDTKHCQTIIRNINKKAAVISDRKKATADKTTYQIPEEFSVLRKNFQNIYGMAFRDIYFRQSSGINNNQTEIENRKLINYCSYNYLGMVGDPHVARAAQKAIEKYGTSVSASRLASGERLVHTELEQKIADFLGTEDSISFVGGYLTNETIIGNLFHPGDLIIYDSFIHTSIQQGAKLSGAAIKAFPHNNWKALDEQLTARRHEYNQVLIIIEGAYSMDGDIPDLPSFISIKKKHNALLMIDEAHSIGVLGNTGRGIGEYFGVTREDVDLWMGTLSKAFASCGGYIAGKKDLIEFIKFSVPGLVYSVGMTPPNTASALAAIDLLMKEPQRIERLHQNSGLFLKLARQMGLDTGLSKDTAIVPLIIGNSQRAVGLYKSLYNAGIYVLPMLYPVVPENSARLRFFISSSHTKKEIHYTIDTISELIKITYQRGA